MILDELVEKKTARNYCQIRVKNLKRLLEPKNIRKVQPPQSRELARARVFGRIAELKLLSGRLDALKKWSIREYESLPASEKTRKDAGGVK